MKLKYVGPVPKVSHRGVVFDKNRPDKFTYLSAALELAEAFDFKNSDIEEHTYRPKGKTMSESEMMEKLQKYCDDIDSFVKQREEKARELVEDLRQHVQSATTLSEESRRAWLKNIDAMYDYYLQYVTNEAAYECVLDKIADEIKEAKIKEIKVPMFQNFGMVLHDLVEVLENKKPPIDSELLVEKLNDGFFGVMKLRHP